MTQRIRLFWFGVLVALATSVAAILAAPSVVAFPIDSHGHTICPPGNSDRGRQSPGNSPNKQCLITPTVAPTKAPHPHPH